jgi:hypothetical protein
MASALTALENASVTFVVPAAGTVTDAATGNVRAATTTTTVALYLKAEKSAYRPLPGIDVDEVRYSGYALNPVAFPAGVVEGTTGTLTFAGEASVECRVVELRTPYGKTGLIGGTLNSVLGEAVVLVARGQR